MYNCVFIIKDCTLAQTGRVFETKENTKHIHPDPDIKQINHYIPVHPHSYTSQTPQTEANTGFEGINACVESFIRFIYDCLFVSRDASVSMTQWISL